MIMNCLCVVSHNIVLYISPNKTRNIQYNYNIIPKTDN